MSGFGASGQFASGQFRVAGGGAASRAATALRAVLSPVLVLSGKAASGSQTSSRAASRLFVQGVMRSAANLAAKEVPALTVAARLSGFTASASRSSGTLSIAGRARAAIASAAQIGIGMPTTAFVVSAAARLVLTARVGPTLPIPTSFRAALSVTAPVATRLFVLSRASIALAAKGAAGISLPIGGAIFRGTTRSAARVQQSLSVVSIVSAAANLAVKAAAVPAVSVLAAVAARAVLVLKARASPGLPLAAAVTAAVSSRARSSSGLALFSAMTAALSSRARATGASVISYVGSARAALRAMAWLYPESEEYKSFDGISKGGSARSFSDVISTDRLNALSFSKAADLGSGRGLAAGISIDSSAKQPATSITGAGSNLSPNSLATEN